MSLNQRPLSSASVHQALLFRAVHSNVSGTHKSGGLDLQDLAFQPFYRGAIYDECRRQGRFTRMGVIRRIMNFPFAAIFTVAKRTASRGAPSKRQSLSEVCLFAAALALSTCWISCSGGGCSIAPIMPPPSPAALGGSNYGWYHLDPPCNREPYGVVYNYDIATATIDSQLQEMYSDGQRRLRVPIFFGRGLNPGSVMDSTGGTCCCVRNSTPKSRTRRWKIFLTLEGHNGGSSHEGPHSKN